MRTLIELRQEHPNTPFEARPLSCADGMTRMMVLHPWYWEKLDLLLAVDCNSLDDITRFCQSLAHSAVRNEGWDIENAFRELLMYYIYRNYQGYMAVRHNLTNDNRDNCFAHLKD